MKQKSPECWVKNAFVNGDFFIFSHRSFVNISQQKQPTCQEALQQLKSVGVSHLDLDLIFGKTTNSNNNSRPQEPQLVVSHPMEFKRTSSYYSPCSLMKLEDLIVLLDETFGSSRRESSNSTSGTQQDDRKWFISLEPKASWSPAQKEKNDPSLAEPSDILTELLNVARKYNLRRDECAVIVDVSTLGGQQETTLLHQLLEHCELFTGYRRTDPVSETLQIGEFQYDYVMPTIEFHPNHDYNKKHSGSTSALPRRLYSKSIFWVVDNEIDFRLAAELHPHGIVSNNPKEIVRILEDPAWCPSSSNSFRGT